MSLMKTQEIVLPGPRSGVVEIPASKSQAHRLLICASLGQAPAELICHGLSRDIEATALCLRALGAGIVLGGDRIRVEPIAKSAEPSMPRGEENAVLPCGESGSTLRFLLPVTGALGVPSVFRMEGRLPERPLSPLKELLESRGMEIRRDGDLLFCRGRLTPGVYRIPGNISSQFVSGLLFALPLLSGDSRLEVTGPVESEDYIRMTENALSQTGWRLDRSGNEYHIPGGQKGNTPALLRVESDWSSAAFPLAMGALSPIGVSLRGMNPDSAQGDRRILDLLAGFGAHVAWNGDMVTVSGAALHGQRIDAASIPDLVPVLSAVASFAEGETVICRAQRLRLKESDRLQTTSAMLSGLGADIRETADGLIIRGKPEGIRGGAADSFGDHRIAMSAAVAASRCAESVTVLNARCTDKSFPGFWETLRKLTQGGT